MPKYTYECNCSEWEEFIIKLDSMVEFSTIHGYNSLMGCETFKYCPWCGFRLNKYDIVTGRLVDG